MESRTVRLAKKTISKFCWRASHGRSRQLWPRALMRAQTSTRIALHRERPAASRTGLEVAEVRIKRMKTRWGSCNATVRRIWLNLELAKKPPSCLEYVLVHEMIHFWERRHNERFRDLMDKFMPTWQTIRRELNTAPLAHENWRY